MPNGKRNVRILFISLIVYIFLHAILFELKDANIFCKIFHGYFIWILLADILLCAILYKSYYGRSILNELNPMEKDYYDEDTHRYYNFGNMTNVNTPQDEYTQNIFDGVEIIVPKDKESDTPKIEIIDDLVEGTNSEDQLDNQIDETRDDILDS